MRNVFCTGLVLALATGAGCKWTEFDDLENQTWVSSTQKPNGDSTDYGVAMQRAQRNATGGKLVVIGASQAQFTELVYAPNGDETLAPTALKLNTQFGIGNLDTQPILLADPTPTSDDVSLVVNSGGQSIAVLTGSGGLIAHQVFGPEQPDAATYMVPPPRVDQPALPTPAQVLVGAVDGLYGAFVANTPNPQPKCQLVDETSTAITVRSLGTARVSSQTYDDVVVWGVTTTGTPAGKLLLYPGSVFNGPPPVGDGTCSVMTQPLVLSTPLATTFVPGKGSQILVIDGTHFVVVGHKDLGTPDSFLALFKIDPVAKSFAVVGTPVTLPDLRTAAIYDDGTKKYVVAGYPTALFDGVKAGHVMVFPLDLTNGIDGTPAMTLNDAQPEDQQQFGRAIAVTPFNGHPAIAVAADNEIFFYYRTQLYDETRTGK